MNEKVRLKFDAIGNFSTMYVGCTIGTIRRDPKSDWTLLLEGTTAAGTRFRMDYRFDHQVNIERVYSKLKEMVSEGNVKILTEKHLKEKRV